MSKLDNQCMIMLGVLTISQLVVFLLSPKYLFAITFGFNLGAFVIMLIVNLNKGK